MYARCITFTNTNLQHPPLNVILCFSWNQMLILDMVGINVQVDAFHWKLTISTYFVIWSQSQITCNPLQALNLQMFVQVRSQGASCCVWERVCNLQILALCTWNLSALRSFSLQVCNPNSFEALMSISWNALIFWLQMGASETAYSN